MNNSKLVSLRHSIRYAISRLMVLVILFWGLGMAGESFSQCERTSPNAHITPDEEEKCLTTILHAERVRKSDSKKILFAMKRLENLVQVRGITSPSTIDILSEYLDVHSNDLIKKDISLDPQHAIIYRPRLTMKEELYPAVIVFQHIGKESIPALVRSIEKSEPSSIITSNAVFLLKYYFREDPSQVADLLQKAAVATREEVSRSRLMAAAAMIVKK